MRNFITIVLLLFAFWSQAQFNVDSVFAFVEQSNSSLQKVEAIAKITQNPSEYKVEELINAIDLMAELAEDSQQTYILYCQNNVLGNYFRYIGNIQLALELFDRNNEISETYRLSPEYLNIGLIYQDQGDDSTAEAYFNQGFEFGSKYGLNIFAYALYFQSKRELKRDSGYALMLIDSAIKIWASLPLGLPQDVYFVDKREPGAIAQVYYTLGSMALANGDLEQAKVHTKEMEHWVKLDSTGNGRLYWLKVNLFRRSGQLDSALYYAQAAVKYHEKPNVLGFEQKGREARSNMILSRVYYDLGDTGQAFKYFRSYEAIRNEIDRNEGVRAIDLHKYQKQREQEDRKREQEKLKSEARQKLRNYMSIATGVVLIIVLLGLYSRLRYVRKTSALIQKEKERSEKLLLNILPAEVAEELKEKGKSEARDYDNVTVLFTDFVQFTQTAEKLSAKDLVNEINTCFKAFDEIIQKYNIEKIKTIGDAYMAAGGLHTPRTSEPEDVVKAAIEMQAFMLKQKVDREAQNLPAFDMRVGIHTGPVVAGIVGVKKFQYDIWGDTVNTASRMESSGAVGKVNISQATYELLKSDPDFVFDGRGKIEVKGKGEMEMWFVSMNS